MSGIDEMAKLFKDRNNPSVQGICVGVVISPSPTLRITANGFILDKTNLVVAKHLNSTYATSETDIATHGSHGHNVSDILKAGDKVIVIPSTNNATYFIVGKVGDI